MVAVVSAGGRMSWVATAAPAWASAMAMAAPIPPAEPVTRATLLSRRKESRMLDMVRTTLRWLWRVGQTAMGEGRVSSVTPLRRTSPLQWWTVSPRGMTARGDRRRPMKLLQMADPVRYARMTSAELRETFLLEGLFTPGKHRPCVCGPGPHGDRLGGAHHRRADAGDAAGAARGVFSGAPRAWRAEHGRAGIGHGGWS